jgi:hypothetical protein
MKQNKDIFLSLHFFFDQQTKTDDKLLFLIKKTKRDELKKDIPVTFLSFSQSH